MESKLRDGTWTPVMRCPRDTPRTSHQGEATPPILLPLAPTGHRHSPHNRIQAAGIILMVRFQDFCSSTTLKSWLKYNLSFQDPYPLVRQTPGSPMLTRHPRTTRMTKIVFTVIVMPWVSNSRISKARKNCRKCHRIFNFWNGGKIAHLYVWREISNSNFILFECQNVFVFLLCFILFVHFIILNNL